MKFWILLLSTLLLNSAALNGATVHAANKGKLVESLHIPADLPIDAVTEIIISSGEGRHFELISHEDQTIVMRLVHRGLSATYTFEYDRQSIQMYSLNFETKKPERFIDFPSWEINFKRSLLHNLERVIFRETDFEETSGEDPENLQSLELGEPVYEFDVPKGLTKGDIQAVIQRAAKHRRFTVTALDSGFVSVRLVDGSVYANYHFKYDTDQVKMYSHVYKKSKPEKLLEKPRWAANLHASAMVYFSQKAD